MAKRTHVGKVIWTLLIILVVLLLAAEIALRFIVGRQFEHSVAQQAQESGISEPADPKISFGWHPLLLSVITKNVSHVDLTTPDTLNISWPGSPGDAPNIKGQPEAHVILSDVDISDSQQPVAQHMETNTTLSGDYLRAVLQKNMAGETSQEDYATAVLRSIIHVTAVTTNAQDNTMNIEFTDGAASLTLRPSAVNGDLNLETVNSSFFGINLSDNINQAISRVLSQGTKSKDRNLTIQDAKITDGGLELLITGDNVNLNQIATSTSAH
ncbi:DUF2993 domain-containing protein [Corynebacterium poyangense]|uniref:DUF2993 domain-containing protein n=1 Tax=Corynebacterium poyangense TaxID=2684405 RepID=A0A7H0SLT0_9CORY|nr:LmeA family phospholipid-binding protein [Corynebacterium poyangense]MBZ8177612.1 LmeA family phospholipid-binding protein [Corynebacterium poyangense]QNQ89505.1 DUF2993 domain-containing protein [Corynebacterium poyangense]